MKHNALAEKNTHLSLNQHIYTDVSQANSGYGLSSYLSIAVPRLFKRVNDARLFSYQLEQQLDTPELRDEFSPALYNILRVCDFERLKERENALDLTQDFGGTAQYLSEKFVQVDAVKLNLDRAQLSRNRFAETLNIAHYACDLNRLSLPIKHYDFIYVGNLDALETHKSKHPALLAMLSASLSTDGVLLFSATNRRRLSAWLNNDRHENDPPTPWLSLYQTEKNTYFDLSELKKVLSDVGFCKPNVNASFSARGGLNNLFSLDYLDSNPNALNHFCRIGSIANSEVNEYLLYQAQQSQGNQLSQLASRYVVCASNNDEAAHALYRRDFCHFPGSGRRPEWRAITSKATDLNVVTKQHSLPKHNHKSSVLRQSIAPQAFKSGALLIHQWLIAIINRDDNTFKRLIKDYYSWLTAQQSRDDFSTYAYDLLPFNIVCAADKSKAELSNSVVEHSKPSELYQIIDPEWCLDTTIDADFVLFRALFWFAFENRSLMAGFAEHWGLLNIDSFVRYYMGTVSTDLKINSFIAFEERIQREISHTFNAGSVSLAMHHAFLLSAKQQQNLADTRINTQITWADEHDQFDQANTVNLQWLSSHELQNISTEFCSIDASKPILRVDPLDNAGLFQFEAIALLDEYDQPVWSCTSSAEITERAQLRNTSTADNETGDGKNFISLSDDPFFLFDLSDLINDDLLRTSIRKVSLSISLSFEPNYHNALGKLRSIVSKQADSLKKLGNKTHETRADIDQLHALLSQSEHARAHLQQQLAEMDRVVEKNRELEQTLTQTLNARTKRLLKKLLRLLTLRR